MIMGIYLAILSSSQCALSFGAQVTTPLYLQEIMQGEGVRTQNFLKEHIGKFSMSPPPPYVNLMRFAGQVDFIHFGSSYFLTYFLTSQTIGCQKTSLKLHVRDPLKEKLSRSQNYHSRNFRTYMGSYIMLTVVQDCMIIKL